VKAIVNAHRLDFTSSILVLLLGLLGAPPQSRAQTYRATDWGADNLMGVAIAGALRGLDQLFHQRRML